MDVQYSLSAWGKTWLWSTISHCVATMSLSILSAIHTLETEALYIGFYWILAASTIHSISFILLGIPFFLIFHHRINNPIWSWKVGIPTSFFIGMTPMIFLGIPILQLNPLDTIFTLITGVYGIITGISSIHIHKKTLQTPQLKLHPAYSITEEPTI